jgi:hypothetical protein
MPREASRVSGWVQRKKAPEGAERGLGAMGFRLKAVQHTSGPDPEPIGGRGRAAAAGFEKLAQRQGQSCGAARQGLDSPGVTHTIPQRVILGRLADRSERDLHAGVQWRDHRE